MTKEKVLRLLGGLGNTSYDVSQSLKKLGVKGFQGASSSCPIAIYLNELAPYEEFTATQGGIYWGNRHSVTAPDPIKYFMYIFDKGGYPELKA